MIARPAPRARGMLIWLAQFTDMECPIASVRVLAPSRQIAAALVSRFFCVIDVTAFPEDKRVIIANVGEWAGDGAIEPQVVPETILRRKRTLH